MRLAEDTAMLDHLSLGQTEFGAGTGVTSHEFLLWNVEFDRQWDISEEAIEVILRAWTKDEATFQGEHFQFDEALTTPKHWAFVTRHVHVVETDAKAREEAEEDLLMARSRSRPSDNGELDSISQTRIVYWMGEVPGEASTPDREELRRVFQEQAKFYDFSGENRLALVGSPYTVARKIEEQQKLVGQDILCTRQRSEKMSPEVANSLIKLFVKEVSSALS